MKHIENLGLSFRTAAVLLVLSATTTGAFAQAGTLDPDFATAGIGTYLIESTYDRGFEIIALADNSMLVCGEAYINNVASAFVTHIQDDGTVDTSFGESNGYTFFPGAADAMVLAPDQSIYLAGNSGPDMLLAHVSALGIPIADIGPDGVVITSVSPYAVATDMLMQPDGKIVVAYTGAGVNSDSFFMRYLTDGTLDNSFNGTGVATVAISLDDVVLYAVGLMDDGSIVGTGWNDDGSILVKLSADGTPYPSFGTNGILSFSVGGTAELAWDIQVVNSSLYVVGETSFPGNDGGYLAKFNDDGTFDTGFGTNGRTVTDIGVTSGLNVLTAQLDGKIVASGNTYDPVTEDLDVLVARFGQNGVLDPTFGDAGKTITNLGPDYDQLNCIAIQPDGKIVGTGYTNSSNSSMVVLRYLGDGTIGIASNETSFGQPAIFPNPVASNSTTVSISNAEGAEVWISDLQGRMIGSRINVPKGMTSAVLSTSNLATGNYIVNVLSQGTMTGLKLQVAK